jgi:hypothetical protein
VARFNDPLEINPPQELFPSNHIHSTMKNQRFFAIVTSLFLIALVGCRKDLLKSTQSILADRSITDAQAASKLAELYYQDATSISTAMGSNGKDVELTVTVRPHREPELTAAEKAKGRKLHKGVLPLPIINTHDVIKFGRQRNLTKVVVKIQDTIPDDSGNEQKIDLFGFTVDQDNFQKFLTTNLIQQLMTGNPRDVIQPNCTIDYDNFDKQVFSKQ